MGIKELAAKVAAAHPELPAGQINKVLRTALTELGAELAAAADGAVKLAPLGSFHISTKPAKGEEGGEAKRRVTVKLAAAKDGDAKAAKQADKQAGKQAGAVKPERAEKQAEKAARQAGRVEKKATRQAGKASKAA